MIRNCLKIGKHGNKIFFLTKRLVLDKIYSYGAFSLLKTVKNRYTWECVFLTKRLVLDKIYFYGADLFLLLKVIKNRYT